MAKLDSLYDWSRKLTPSSQPIRRRTRTNHDLVIRVLQFAWFYFEFSLANDEANRRCDWPLRSLCFVFFNAHLKDALKLN